MESNRSWRFIFLVASCRFAYYLLNRNAHYFFFFIRFIIIARFADIIVVFAVFSVAVGDIIVLLPVFNVVIVNIVTFLSVVSVL